MFHTLLRLLSHKIFREQARNVAGQANLRIHTDKVKDEPILEEEALVHAKSEHTHVFIIHFYIAARDTVVNCALPKDIWQQLRKGQRGTLRHQGGLFCHFESEGHLYRDELSL